MDTPTNHERFYRFRSAVISDLNLAETLIAGDPDILEARNGLGETVFHFLVVENYLSCVAWLLSKGAQVDTVNEFGSTPLVEAASLGYLEMCQFLVSHGANPRHISSGRIRYSAISQAAQSDHLPVLNYILSLLQPDEDINSYIDDLDAEMILKHNQEAAEILTARGLKKRWLDDD